MTIIQSGIGLSSTLHEKNFSTTRTMSAKKKQTAREQQSRNARKRMQTTREEDVRNVRSIIQSSRSTTERSAQTLHHHRAARRSLRVAIATHQRDKTCRFFSIHLTKNDPAECEPDPPGRCNRDSYTTWHRDIRFLPVSLGNLPIPITHPPRHRTNSFNSANAKPNGPSITFVNRPTAF